MRKQTTSLVAKDFYKLMNNSVFGKTQENLRNRVNVEVITKRNVALKRVCKPSFKRSQMIREDLVIVQNAISNRVLNKPIYVRFTVLELSKLLMCEFHHEKMLQWEDGYFLYSTVNKKVLGKFKDELNGRPLFEFIGLRPKCYSLLFLDR